MAIETTPRHMMRNTHTARAPRQYPLSDKQRTWLPALQDEAARLARSAYALEVDMVYLAEGEHTDATRADVAASVQRVANDVITGIRAYRADTMTSGEFSLLVALRDSLRKQETRNRETVGRKLSRRAGRPVTGAVSAAPAQDAPVLPEGYYAVEYLSVLRFYRLVHGKGRHAGRVFLNRFRSDAEDYVGRAERDASLALIAQDEQAARMRFAQESKHCYACGRRLTDETSRALGIGPDCRSK